MTLLLAATFEEFVREMAREFAVQVVTKASAIADLPDRLLEVAWQRTLDQVMRKTVEAPNKKEMNKLSAGRARPKLEPLLNFMEGDISQDIFEHLIHNENNMRPGEINKMFKISGLSSTCHELCKSSHVKGYFAEDDEGRASGRLIWIRSMPF